MVDVRRVKLPGVGVLHTFVTDDGGKVGVIAHRSGHSDLITFSDDEDTTNVTKVSLRLNEDEAHTLAELLGGTQITVDYEDYIAGQRLGTPAEVGMVGLTVVAVVRGESTNPAPAADFKVFPGDTLVVAGSPEKVAKAFTYFRTGEVAKPALADAPPGV
jgi:TrkA domain protein